MHLSDVCNRIGNMFYGVAAMDDIEDLRLGPLSEQASPFCFEAQTRAKIGGPFGIIDASSHETHCRCKLKCAAGRAADVEKAHTLGIKLAQAGGHQISEMTQL